jgi:hypothetical protein
LAKAGPLSVDRLFAFWCSKSPCSIVIPESPVMKSQLLASYRHRSLPRQIWGFLFAFLLALPQTGLAQDKPSSHPSGYFALVQVGPLLFNPKQEISGYRSSTQIDFIQGAQLFPQASLGLGVGLSIFEVGYLIPLYADLRGDLLAKRKFSPHYFGQLGYNFEVFPEGEGLVGETWHSNYEAQGGIHYGFGAGLRVKTDAHYDWLFTLGVRNFRITERDQLWSGSWTTTRLSFQRLMLAAGLRF